MTDIVAPTIPLGKLKFGDDRPGGSINVRTDKRTDDLDELGASILAEGVIQALAIEMVDGVAYVVDGNRRLRAMRALLKSRKLSKDYPVKVTELDQGTGALEASLAANLFRLPLHELDQFEAFAKLAAQAMPVADIASRFGTSERHVRQRMALGNLCPGVRAAWRDAKLPADAAQAFTLTADHELQAKVYRSLAKGQNLYKHAVVRALTGDIGASGSSLALVGREAYAAAGGRFVEDLFEDKVHVFDGELLVRLARDRLQVECDWLLAAGWAWAVIRSDVDHPWHYRELVVEPDFTPEEEGRLEELVPVAEQPWDGLVGEAVTAKQRAIKDVATIRHVAWARTVTASHRAETGCIVNAAPDGSIEIRIGLLRPEDERPIEPAMARDDDGDGDQAEEEQEGSAISAVLSQSLSEQRTLAAAKAIERNPVLALAVAMAALRTSQSPARLGSNGLMSLASHFKAGGGSIAEVRDFGKVLSGLIELPTVKLVVELAPLVARSLDLTDKTRDNPGVAVRNQDAQVDALPAEDYLDAVRALFDPDDFSYRAPARVAVDAMVEMTGGNPCRSKKKADLAAAAAALVTETGWLPPQLRSAHYAIAKPAAASTPRKRGRPAAVHAAAE